MRLLIADDDPDDVEICIAILRESGLLFEAETVSTRELYAQRLHDSAFDVILSDYRMRGWTGMDALAMAKTICPDVPLILISGSLGDELAVKCIKNGFTDYVLKGQIARLPNLIQRAQEEKELRQAETRALAALRQSERHYRTLVNSAHYGLYWVTLDGKWIFVNPALARMVGFESSAELMALGDTSPLYCDSKAREQVHEQFRSFGRVDVSVDWKRKDGKIIHVRLNGRELYMPEGAQKGAEVLVEDITEQRSLQRQLAQAQKFEAIGQLAGGIAHDFNNMIGAILGWADMGVEETEANTRLRKHFEKIRQQGDRAAALTKQMLAFARKQILEPRNIDLNQTVVETLNLLEKILGSNIEIRANLNSELGIVQADPTQIEQVVMNLCINARDAMPNGGLLFIETCNVRLEEGFCGPEPIARAGSYVLLSVSDSGIGMDAATLDRIFEPFFTTKEVGKGTGLGLATVYGIIRQHNGLIQVSSEPGVGSTFRIYLPLADVEHEDVLEKQPEKAIERGSETLLLAEDHEGLRQLAAETLSNLGYKVIIATDGEDAVTEFREHRGEIRLALLDVVMPKLSGPEAYEKICEHEPELPVIFATGYSADICLLQKTKAKGLPVLQKPYETRDLARKVRELLDRRKSANAVQGKVLG